MEGVESDDRTTFIGVQKGGTVTFNWGKGKEKGQKKPKKKTGNSGRAKPTQEKKKLIHEDLGRDKERHG